MIFCDNRYLEEEATLLVEVREAGRFLELEDLSSAAAATIADLVFRSTDNERYHFAAAFVTGLDECGENKGPLWRPIYRFTVDNAMKCFGPSPKLLCRIY